MELTEAEVDALQAALDSLAGKGLLTPNLEALRNALRERTSSEPVRLESPQDAA